MTRKSGRLNKNCSSDVLSCISCYPKCLWISYLSTHFDSVLLCFRPSPACPSKPVFFTSYLMLGLQLAAKYLEDPFGYDLSDLALDEVRNGAWLLYVFCYTPAPCGSYSWWQRRWYVYWWWHGATDCDIGEPLCLFTLLFLHYLKLEAFQSCSMHNCRGCVPSVLLGV